jgi:hypothetical protein
VTSGTGRGFGERPWGEPHRAGADYPIPAASNKKERTTRGILRPWRLGAVGICLALLTTLVAAPVASAPAARPWMNASLSPRARAQLLLARMTREEKIGQMTQAERGAVTGDPSLIATWKLGSLLSGGGSTPTPNTSEAWANMVDTFQAQALRTRLGIPLIYGVDSVHGHGSLVGATVFPHNIGDPDYHPLYPFGWGLRTRASH